MYKMKLSYTRAKKRELISFKILKNRFKVLRMSIIINFKYVHRHGYYGGFKIN